MPVPLSKTIGKLRQSSARLNELTDEASETIKEVEEFLSKDCSIGIPAHVCVQQTSDEGGRSQYLEYRRVGARFRIAVVWTPDESPDQEIVRPWSDCPRDEKLETIKFVPKLIAEIAKQVDEKIIEAEKAMKTVSRLLHSFSGEEA